MTELIKIAEDFLKMVSSELDPYTKTKGVIISTDNSSSLFTPSHLQFAKYGRGPGKQPPLEPIIEWLEGEGKVLYEDVKSTGFAISRSIGEKGTLNWEPNAPNAMDEAIQKYLQSFIEQINVSVKVSLLQEMQGIQYFPKEIIYKI